MKESIPLYAICDYEGTKGIVWETELGRIVTLEGKLDIKNNINIKEILTGEEISDIDLRNVLMGILPINE